MAKSIDLQDARALVTWTQTKLQDFEQRRQTIKAKLLNGKNCGKKADRDQRWAQVVLWEEIGKEPSNEAKDVTAFARSYLFRHGPKFVYKQITKGPLIIGVVRLRLKEARRATAAA